MFKMEIMGNSTVNFAQSIQGLKLLKSHSNRIQQNSAVFSEKKIVVDKFKKKTLFAFWHKMVDF